MRDRPPPKHNQLMEIVSFSRQETHIDNSYETDPSSPSIDSQCNDVNENDEFYEERFRRTPATGKAYEAGSIAKFAEKGQNGFRACRDFLPQEHKLDYYSSCVGTLSNMDENAVDITFGPKKKKSALKSSNKSATLSFNGKIEYYTRKQSPMKATELIAPSTKKDEPMFLNSPDIFADSGDEEYDLESSKLAYTSTYSHPSSPDTKASSLLDETKSARSSLNDLASDAKSSSHLEETTSDGLKKSSNKIYKENCQLERVRLRRAKNRLAGIPPPPSVTMPQVNLFAAVSSKKDAILNFFNDMTPTTPTKLASTDNGLNEMIKMCWQPTHSESEARALGWRDSLRARAHGLHHYFNEASEQNSRLGLLITQRFVSSETRSSFATSPTSAKKRNMRAKMLPQSPGNRLSHLAKRRAAFSSESLATKSKNIFSNQIIITKSKAIKTKYKATPKRKTPSSKLRTPSSSAKKRLYRSRFVLGSLASRESSRRALFQSPAKVQTTAPPEDTVRRPQGDRVKEKTKRALFQSDNTDDAPKSLATWTPSSASREKLETLLKRKRDADDDDDDYNSISVIPNSKQFCPNGAVLTPRGLSIKSKSFCNGADVFPRMTSCSEESFNASYNSALGSNTPASNIRPSSESIILVKSSVAKQTAHNESTNSSILNNTSIVRSHSEQVKKARDLSETQRKKLLWAVSVALHERKVDMKHERFKAYASVLARVVRLLFQEFYTRHSHFSNSEAMLHLAKKHAYSVVRGESLDEIYAEAKAEILESMRSARAKPTGYITSKDYEALNATLIKKSSSTSSILQRVLTSTPLTGGCNLGSPKKNKMSLGNVSSKSNPIAIDMAAQYKSPCKSGSPARPNPATHNSSSKSNLGGLALRENSQKKKQPMSFVNPQLTHTKAKRHIDFDI